MPLSLYTAVKQGMRAYHRFCRHGTHTAGVTRSHRRESSPASPDQQSAPPHRLPSSRSQSPPCPRSLLPRRSAILSKEILGKQKNGRKNWSKESSACGIAGAHDRGGDDLPVHTTYHTIAAHDIQRLLSSCHSRRAALCLSTTDELPPPFVRRGRLEATSS